MTYARIFNPLSVEVNLQTNNSELCRFSLMNLMSLANFATSLAHGRISSEQDDTRKHIRRRRETRFLS